MDRPSENPLAELIERIAARADTGEAISIAALRDMAGERIAGPLIFFPAMVIVSPLSVVPLLPSTVAITVILISVQLILGRKTVWLPRWLLERSLSAERSQQVVKLLRKAAGWIGKVSRPRLGFLVEGLGLRLAAAICILVALTMPPLEFFPGASTAAGVVLAVFGLAITMRDGALMLASLGLFIGAGLLIFRLIFG